MKLFNIITSLLLFFSFINEIRAQSCVLRLNGVEAVLNIEHFEEGDSIIHATISVKNNLSKKIYVPNITDTISLEYHFYIREERLFFYSGVMCNFWGPLNLGMWVVVMEIPPQSTKIFPIKLQKKTRNISIKEITFMFEYYPNKKKSIKIIDNEKRIKGVEYWDNCINVYSIFKFPDL